MRVDSRDTRAMASFGMDRESVDLDEIAAIQLPEYDVRREKDRRFRRTVFNHDRWSAHRSTDRYARHLLGLFRSRTFVSLMRPLTLLTSFAFTVGKLACLGMAVWFPKTYSCACTDVIALSFPPLAGCSIAAPPVLCYV